MKITSKLLSAFCLFSIGAVTLTVGIVTEINALSYVSAAFSSSGIILSIYLCMKDRRQPTLETPVFPLRVYRDPGMKKNKSDTNLELMETVSKNTTMEVAEV